jgi:hypothetical protein
MVEMNEASGNTAEALDEEYDKAKYFSDYVDSEEDEVSE